jgi:hypothetical protein
MSEIVQWDCPDCSSRNASPIGEESYCFGSNLVVLVKAAVVSRGWHVITGCWCCRSMLVEHEP